MIADATGHPCIDGEREAREAALIIFGTKNLRDLKAMLAEAEGKADLLRRLISEIEAP